VQNEFERALTFFARASTSYNVQNEFERALTFFARASTSYNVQNELQRASTWFNEFHRSLRWPVVGGDLSKPGVSMTN
jgi:hypothetical protein